MHNYKNNKLKTASIHAMSNQTDASVEEPEDDDKTLELSKLELPGPPDFPIIRQYRIPIGNSSKELYDVINSPIAIEIHLDVSGSGWVNWFYGKMSNGDYYKGFETIDFKRTVYKLTEPLDPNKLCSK